MLNYYSTLRVTGNCFLPDKRCIRLLMDCHRGDQHTCLTPVDIYIPKRVRNYFHTVYHVEFGTYRALKFDSNDVKLTFAS